MLGLAWRSYQFKEDLPRYQCVRKPLNESPREAAVGRSGLTAHDSQHRRLTVDRLTTASARRRCAQPCNDLLVPHSTLRT